MLRIKQIDKLVFNGFIGPYLLSFFVAEFVLIMQFLWKHIDRILGKGISFFQIMELLFFMAIKLIPMAIPLTILISSVMVFGNMSEKYELSSIKSAGVSLIRTMRPGLYLAIATAIFSASCSNFFVPKANFEFQTRFERIKRTKPTLSFEEGIFSDDFKGYAIKIGEKHKDGKQISDIIIEDHTNADKSLVNVTIAKTGDMYTTADGNYFVMNLVDGEQYKDIKSKPVKSGSKNKRSEAFMRTNFKRWTKVFEMSGFSFNENLFELNRNKYDLLNTFQLLDGLDTIDAKIDRKINSNHILSSNKPQRSLSKYQNQEIKQKKESSIPPKNRVDSPKAKALKSSNKTKKAQKKRKVEVKVGQVDSVDVGTVASILETLSTKDQVRILKNTKTKINFVKDRARRSQNSIKAYNAEKNRYTYKLNESYSWALVCIIFLFIGAPLGSIIRKGGYGYPLLFAIVFYMLFMIMVIMGQKLLKSNSINPILAAWLPCIVLVPVAIQLTYKARNDSKMNSIGFLGKLMSRFQSSS